MAVRHAWCACLLLLAGCSGNAGPSPGPSPVPQPSPSRITVSGTLTSTTTGATIGSFSREVERLPVLLPVSLNGFVSREAWITSSTPTVDLIPEPGFDLTFYRQFVRGALDGRTDPIRRWTQAPSIYLQRTGLSDATVAALERAARDVVPALTGGRFQVAAWDTGLERRSAQSGWIVVELVTEPAVNSCGRAEISAGHIWLNIAALCHHQGHAVHAPLFAHELGHALGFYHVRDDAALMTDLRNIWLTGTITARERHHAALAYARPVGSRDVDVDPSGSSALMPRVVVD